MSANALSEAQLSRVLIVDDNEDDVLIVRDLLAEITTRHFDLQWAPSYDAAREALSGHAPDICLVDYRLGEHCAIDLLQEFSGGAVPFVLLTGVEDYEADAAATRAGAADYLVKAHINAPLLERSIRYAIERKRSQQSVLASELRYRRLFESARDGILILDAATRKITDVNPYMTELLGFSRAEFLGKELWEIGLLGDARASAEAFRQLQADGFIRYEDLPLETKAGGRWDVEFVSNVYGQNGHQVIQCNIRDITERKRAENALRVSEARFQSIVANVPGTVYQFVLGPDGSVEIPFVNEGCRELFGVEPEEIQRHACLVMEAIHPADRPETQRLMAKSAQTLSPWRWEGRIKLPSGKTKWIQGASRPRRLPDGGTLWDGLLIDITARKEAEEERDRFFTLSLDMLAIMGADGSFKRLNPAFEATLGFSNAELMARPFVEWVHPDDRAAARKNLEKMESGLSARFENRYLCRDGSYKWLSWRTMPFEDLCYAVAHDVSKVKRAEAALHKANDELELRVIERTAELAKANQSLSAEIAERQMAMGALREAMGALQKAKAEEDQAREAADAANRAKSEFLSRMSHELRTPLNAILGFGQILQMRSLGPKESEGVAQILRAGRHLLQLINEVLDIARIEAGHLSLSREPLEVAAALRESLDLVRPLAAAQNIELVNTCDGDSAQTCHVLADRQRLHQVLINLLSNAVKYNRAGGSVTLRCTLPETDFSPSRLRIEVIDSGYGLAPEALEKLFVPFERLGAERSAIEGTGIGLALCKRLIEAMEGRIGVQSEPQIGSTFWVELPLAERTSMSLHPLDEDPALPLTLQDIALATQPATLLYIEDNVSNLKVIERLLADFPHFRLLTAMQGGLGIELAQQHRPDLILLDIHLPDILGDEVLSRLQSCAATRDIPVLILSADATQKRIDKLLQAGAANYLAKPLDIRELLRVVEEILRKRT